VCDGAAEWDDGGRIAVKLYYSSSLNPRVAVAVAKYLRAPVELVVS
jgi:hypothetical protein